jgi:hypothetical protein
MSLQHSYLEHLEWLGLHNIEPRECHAMQNVKEWWNEVIHKKMGNQIRLCMASPAMFDVG